MNMENKIDTKLKKIFLNVFQDLKDADFYLNKPRRDFENWDSLSHLQLVSEIESAFDIRFEMEDIIEIESPVDFKILIEKKLNKNK